MAIRHNEKANEMALELWSLYPKTLNSRLQFSHLVDLIRRFISYLCPKYSDSETVFQFVNELFMFRILMESKTATNGNTSFSRPSMQNSVNFDEFFALLIDYYFESTLNPSPLGFRLFFKILMRHVCEWNEVRSEITKCRILTSPELCAELKLHSMVATEESRKTATFARKQVDQSRKFLALDKIEPLGSFTRSFIKSFAMDSSEQVFENSEALSNIVASEARFMVRFAFKNKRTTVFISPVSHVLMLFERLTIPSGGKKYLDILDPANSQAYLPEGRLKHLAKRNRPIDYVSTLPVLEFTFERTESLRLALARAMRIGNWAETFESLKVNEKLEEVSGSEEWLFRNRNRPDPAPKRPSVYLIFGKPFSGKSTLARALSKAFQIPLIDLDELVASFLRGEMSENLLEEVVQLQQRELASLKEGQPASTVLLRHLLMLRLHSVGSSEGLVVEVGSSMLDQEVFARLFDFLNNEETFPKSSILEHGHEQSPRDSSTLKRNSLPVFFIELRLKNEEVLYRAATSQFIEIKEKDGRLASQFERVELALKQKRAEFLASGEVPEELSEQLEKLPEEFRTFVQEKDNFTFDSLGGVVELEKVETQLSSYEEARERIFGLLQRQGAYYLPIDVCGLSPQACMVIALGRLGDSVVGRPLSLEPVDSLAQLRSEGLEVEAFEPQRTWSQFRDVDCVELREKGAVVTGNPGLAVSHLNKLYTFVSEENRKSFLAAPDRFIGIKPSVAGKVNVSLFGNDELRKEARELAGRLGLAFIDPAEFLSEELAQDGQPELLPEGYVGHRYYSDRLAAGQKIDLNVLPALLLLSLGVALEPHFGDDDDKPKSDAKKRNKRETKTCLLEHLETKESRARFARLAEARARAAENPELPEPELEPAAYDRPYKGFLFFNYPATPGQLEQLAQFNLAVDRFIWTLGEPEAEGETEPGSEARELLRQALVARCSEEELLAQPFDAETVLDFVDPFIPKVDRDKFFGEATEEAGRVPEPYGPFGRYCPVSMLEQQVFCFGRREFSVTFNGKRVLFLNEDHKNHFIRNSRKLVETHRYFPDNLDRHRRFYIAGAIGSGARTLSTGLATHLKTQPCNLQQELIARKLAQVREIVELFDLRQGFVEPHEDEPAAEEPPTRTDREAIEVFRSIPDTAETELEKTLLRELLGDDGFRVFLIDPDTNEQNSGLLSQDFTELLAAIDFNIDHLIVLRNGEYCALRNLFDETKVRKSIEEENQKLLEDHAIKVKEALENDPEAEEPPQPELGDPDVAVEAQREAIKTRRERQLERLEDLFSRLRDGGAKLHFLTTESPPPRLLNEVIRVAQEISAATTAEFRGAELFVLTDETDGPCTERKVERLLKSGEFSLSDFRFQNCLKPYLPALPEFAFALGKEIYFVGSEEELKKVSFNPKLIPRSMDLNFRLFNTRIFCLQPLISKTFAKEIEGQLGIKPISFKRVVKTIFATPDFKTINFSLLPDLRLTRIASESVYCPEMDSMGPFNIFDLSLASINQKLVNGLNLTDDEKVFLVQLYLRSPLADSKGFFIHSFPENINQAKLLASSEFAPSIVVTFGSTFYNLIQTIKNKKDYFAEQTAVYATNKLKQIPHLEIFYAHNFDNLVTLDRSKSEFLNTQLLAELLEKSNAQKLKACELFNKDKPVAVEGLHLSHKFLSTRVFKSGNFAGDHLLSRNSLSIFPSHQVIFKDSIFYSSEKISERQSERLFMMLKDAKKLTLLDSFDISFKSIMLRNSDFTENFTAELIDKDFCRVCVADSIYKQANKSIGVEFEKDSVFFCSSDHLSVFLKNPKLFTLVKFNPKSIKRAGKPRLVIPEEKVFIDRLLQAMNQVTGLRIKCPHLTLKETSLLLLSILLRSLGSRNDPERQRLFQQKAERLIRLSLLPEQLSKTYLNKIHWTESEKEIFLKNTEEFLSEIENMNNIGKREFFKNFIK